ncbi:hypothetical protein [Cyclobacterium sp.]|uniref:hypothetical protein n=1 Tax=Cyclobacterium sp. TaxID=1966343 RepID=UPI0019B7ACBA|nr:hypothetical protein [Cyclobacterium sp.]MBD3631119.1 hypothetical protein [Cyclobacterium sp.]
MKTNISLVSAVCILVSCQEDLDVKRPDLDLSNAPERFEQMYSDGLGVAIQSLDEILKEENGKMMYLDRQSLQTKTFQHWENNYILIDNFDSESFLGESLENKNFGNTIVDPHSLEFLETLEDAYSREQLPILLEFLNELFESDDFGKAKFLSKNFHNKLFDSNLSNEEKLELHAIGSGVYALADFLENGGMDRFGEQMAVLVKGSGYSSNLRCRVDMRAVWASAVVSGGINAVRGGVIGCAGGTVVFPLLGTASGCVGGAVMGGAVGFIEGAFGGLAGSLLLTCWR